MDILLAVLILGAAILALGTGLLRPDLVALLAMVLVAALGLVPSREALAGSANPAVLAMAGMFVISAGLARTDVAEMMGIWLVRWTGPGELRLMTAITVAAGFLSGLMINVGVAAMMLPVVVTAARRTSLPPPSRRLNPMALGAQLGGFITLIGTAMNLIASDALAQAGYAPFNFFSYTPVGLILLLAGSLLVAVAGPALLPERAPTATGEPVQRPGIRGAVNLRDRLFVLELPERSFLDGRTLAESLIGSALRSRHGAGGVPDARLPAARSPRHPGGPHTHRAGDSPLASLLVASASCTSG